jgi:pyruvate dehydrogenase E1 component alpha subunit
MLVVRTFEDSVQALFLKGLVSGTTHLCQGQEAIAVGCASVLRPDDYTTYTYRGHGHALSRGMSLDAAFGEILGRTSGCNRGRGGSMHLTDATHGLYGSFAIVGAGLPVAVGLAKAAVLSQSGQVSVTFFGDGATNIGAFHEALNLAAVWQAPVIFVCENNLYGEYTRYDRTTRLVNLADRAQAYGIPSEIVDGNDVLVVQRAAQFAADQARNGKGPTFIECKTYRHKGHSRGDPAKYRPEEEVREWLARDPILRSQARLLSGSQRTQDDLDRLRETVAAEVSEARERALSAPEPDPAELESHVYR